MALFGRLSAHLNRDEVIESSNELIIGNTDDITDDVLQSRVSWYANFLFGVNYPVRSVILIVAEQFSVPISIQWPYQIAISVEPTLVRVR